MASFSICRRVRMNFASPMAPWRSKHGVNVAAVVNSTFRMLLWQCCTRGEEHKWVSSAFHFQAFDKMAHCVVVAKREKTITGGARFHTTNARANRELGSEEQGHGWIE